MCEVVKENLTTQTSEGVAIGRYPYDNMTEEEQLKLLSTDGMLVKRPLIISDDMIIVGFREKEYEDKLIK